MDAATLERLKHDLCNLILECQVIHNWGTKENPIKGKVLALMVGAPQRDVRRAISSIEVDPNFNEKVDFNIKGYFLTTDFAQKRKRELKKIVRASKRLKEYARIEHDQVQISFYNSLEDWVNNKPQS